MDVDNLNIIEYSPRGTPPSARSASALLYYNESLYVFGGAEEINYQEITTDNELYKFDLNSLEWSMISVVGEKPIGMHLHRILEYDGYLYLVYGFNIEQSINIQDLWRINLDHPVSWEKLPVTNSSEEMKEIPRSVHSIAVNGSIIYMFGGWTFTQNKNDLYALDLASKPYKWILLSKQGVFPASRRGHATFHLDDHIYIIGGQDETETK